jgi:hypothetical protein
MSSADREFVRENGLPGHRNSPHSTQFTHRFYPIAGTFAVRFNAESNVTCAKERYIRSGHGK